MSKIQNDFRQQLALLLIDKLVLGGFVALLAFFIQSNLDRQSAALEAGQAERDRLAIEEQRIRDVTLAVSRVATEIVNVGRDTVFRSIGELRAMLTEYESEGWVTDPNDRMRLREIVDNIQDSLNQLVGVNPELAVTSDPFVDRVQRIASDLVNNRQRNPEDLQEDARQLLQSYTQLLDELRKTSVFALEADRSAVTAILSRNPETAN